MNANSLKPEDPRFDAGKGRRRSLALPGGRSITLGERPTLMGIVNLTPDSFYEPSRKMDPKAARDRALELLAQGADIVDFGAESTRPGSASISGEEELARLLPAIEAFRKESDAVLSVDTYRAATARAALSAGADIVNDISALADVDMGNEIARASAAVVLMHMQGKPATMQEFPSYVDCVREVGEFLSASVRRSLDAGIRPESIVLDPGIGFGKTLENNIELLKSLYSMKEYGYPVLVGMSRKSFIGALTGKPTQDRLAGSLGAVCAAWTYGADIFRVHDVAATKGALAVFCAVVERVEPR